jgi:hypothetical protein
MNRAEFVSEKKDTASKPKVVMGQRWNSGIVDFGFGKMTCSVEVMYFNPFINKWGLKIVSLKSVKQQAKFIKSVALELTQEEIHLHFDIETRQIRNEDEEESQVMLASPNIEEQVWEETSEEEVAEMYRDPDRPRRNLNKSALGQFDKENDFDF